MSTIGVAAITHVTHVRNMRNKNKTICYKIFCFLTIMAAHKENN